MPFKVGHMPRRGRRKQIKEQALLMHGGTLTLQITLNQAPPLLHIGGVTMGGGIILLLAYICIKIQES